MVANQRRGPLRRRRRYHSYRLTIFDQVEMIYTPREAGLDSTVVFLENEAVDGECLVTLFDLNFNWSVVFALHRNNIVAELQQSCPQD